LTSTILKTSACIFKLKVRNLIRKALHLMDTSALKSDVTRTMNATPLFSFVTIQTPKLFSVATSLGYLHSWTQNPWTVTAPGGRNMSKSQEE
jgi:hypothetical protein